MFGSGKKRSRLYGWFERNHPSMPMLGAGFDRRFIMHRVVLAVATALALTGVTVCARPGLPFRVGEVFARDLRARIEFELHNVPAADHAGDDSEVDSSPIVKRFPAGTLLARRKEPITETQLAILHVEAQSLRSSLRFMDHLRRALSLLMIHLLLCAVVAIYIARYQVAVAKNLPRLIGVAGLAVLTLTLSLLLAHAPWHAAIIPLTVAAMAVTIVFNPPFALLLSFSLSLATTLALGQGTEALLIQTGGCATATLLLRELRSRSQLLRVGIGAGVAFAAMSTATGILTEQRPGMIVSDAMRNIVWAFLAGLVLNGLLPLLERIFGIVTNVSLRDLADTSHPLLQELIRRAPGTYTHCVTVATLAEAAAEAIGANALLTRVGCLFHDVGKMVKPEYFIENQCGTNRHDQLEPALSTLVIVGHVKDGVALAQQYGLPESITDFIRQHHGTTLVEYFYREAMRLMKFQGHAAYEIEHSFRYPGPKPQSREIGISMLADAVESASRALPHATPVSLRKLVHDLMMKRLLDGQFEESGLTLTELTRVEESISRGLIALHHARVRYPEERRSLA